MTKTSGAIHQNHDSTNLDTDTISKTVEEFYGTDESGELNQLPPYLLTNDGLVLSFTDVHNMTVDLVVPREKIER